MSEQYAQTLIPLDKGFVPSSEMVGDFLSSIINMGVVPPPVFITIRTPTWKTREVPNPFTGGKVAIPIKDHHKFENFGQFKTAAERLPDYEIEVSGMGIPVIPPVPIQFAEPYAAEVTCIVSSRLRSTSDYHETESESKSSIIPYGQPSDVADASGVFCHPETLEVIEVPGAGCARFWVEFRLGKFLFPKLVGGNLQILHPAITAEAERIFAQCFVQSCCWG
jgi:hypothetical protein